MADNKTTSDKINFTPVSFIIRLNSDDGQRVGYTIDLRNNLIVLPPEKRDRFLFLAHIMKIKIWEAIKVSLDMSPEEGLELIKKEMSRLEELKGEFLEIVLKEDTADTEDTPSEGQDAEG